MELVSVIIPVYKVEHYLERCIDSVLKQTYSNLEIILINDGSPDNSGLICDSYAIKDSRVKVIHKKNGGLSDARNKGLDVATGLYITFIDSDDWISKTYIEELYLLLQENSADISVCNFLSTDNENIRISDGEFKVIKMNNREAIASLFTPIQIQMTISCGKLFKKDLFETLRFPIGKIHEDEFTTYKALYEANKVIYTEKVMYFYWQRNDSITKGKQKLKNKMDGLEAFQERLVFLEREKFELEVEQLIRIIVLFFNDVDTNMNQFEDKKLFKDKFYLMKLSFLELALKTSKNSNTKMLVRLYKLSPKLIEYIFVTYRMVKKIKKISI